MSPSGESDADRQVTIRFELSAIAVGHAYPPAEVLAEVGRIAVAAARVDRELALNLVAIRHPEPLEVMLTWMTGRLLDNLRSRISELFEGDLLAFASRVVDTAAAALGDRGGVAHSLWDLRGSDALISVADLAAAESEEAMDQLLRRDVASAEWQIHQPRRSGWSARSPEDLRPVRTALEDALDDLRGLRFTLASALFSGHPTGARRVLEP